MVDCAPAPAPHARECKGCPGTLCKVCHGTGHALGCPVERSSTISSSCGLLRGASSAALPLTSGECPNLNPVEQNIKKLAHSLDSVRYRTIMKVVTLLPRAGTIHNNL